MGKYSPSLSQTVDNQMRAEKTCEIPNRFNLVHQRNAVKGSTKELAGHSMMSEDHAFRLF